jgi:hypothetical protein
VNDPAAAVATLAPPCVLEWMRRFAGRLATAGGFVTGAVVVDVDLGSDLDMFVVARTASEGDAIVNAILLDHRVVDARFTGCALTLTIADYHRPVQLVAFLMPSVEQIVMGFDFDPARALAVYGPDDTASDKLRVLATRSWLHAAKSLTFRVDPEGWSSTSTLRVSKYCAKGYRAYMPALDRARVGAYLATFPWIPVRSADDIARVREPDMRYRLRLFQRQRGYRVARCVGEQIASDPGLGSLFLAEWLATWGEGRHSNKGGGGRWGAHARLCEAARGARVSDYDSLLSAEGLIRHMRHMWRGADRVFAWFKAMRRGGAGGGRVGGCVGGGDGGCVGGRGLVATRGHDATRICWRTFAPERRLRAVHAIECDVAEWCSL